MKVSPRNSAAFVKKPDPKARAVLLYGPDLGLVREWGLSLVKAVAEDVNDPFRVVEFTGADLKADPSRLPDEAAAISFTGGRRAVRIRDAGDQVAGNFKDFLADPVGDALIVVEGGDLPARSSLRKAFEAAPSGAAIACYRDENKNLDEVISATLTQAGLSASKDALLYLRDNLGGDRQLTRRELEKLVLYMGTGGQGKPPQVELADAQACVGDSAALGLDDLALAVGAGNMAELERTLTRSLAEGNDPIRILRAVLRHFQRLQLVAGWRGEGLDMEGALKKLRPPLFWKVVGPFKAQATRWAPEALARAITSLMRTEAACKKTGMPAETIMSRTLFAIARQAGR